LRVQRDLDQVGVTPPPHAAQPLEVLRPLMRES